MRVAEKAVAQDDEDAVERELAAWRHEIRLHALAQLERRPARAPWPLRIGAFGLLLLLYVALLIGLRNAMHSPQFAVEIAVQIRLLPPDSPEPSLPVPAVPMRQSPTSTPRTAVRAAPPVTSVAPAAAPAAAVLSWLFNPDGSIRLPAEPVLHVPTAREISAELMQRGHNILHCRQTRFADAYARDESVGDAISRKYLVWIGLYSATVVEARAKRRETEAAVACDG